MSIGVVAARVGLSLRTIRYYEEIGLVKPSGRSVGGFRLYSGEDERRLLLIKRMKPLGYSLEAMAEVLRLVDGLGQGDTTHSAAAAQEGLAEFVAEVSERVERLRTELAHAEEFRDRLLAQLPNRDEGQQISVPAQPVAT